MSAETFTRLILTDPAVGSEEKVELPVDWRAHEPVQLGVKPVLHADDAVANKVCALFGRALPRDFLNVDAAVMSGRYTREQLLGLAAEAGRGFDRLLYADALGALTQITDTASAEYSAPEPIDPTTAARANSRRKTGISPARRSPASACSWSGRRQCPGGVRLRGKRVS